MKYVLMIVLCNLCILLYAPEVSVTFSNRHRLWENIVVLQEQQEKSTQIYKLMQVIRTLESGGNYHAIGASGEYGAYQYMPNTWRYYCLRYFGKTLDIKIESNQDIITEYKIRELLEMGYSVEQLASFWNSGRPEWEGRVGINSYGVAFNVPQYVQTFKSLYNGKL